MLGIQIREAAKNLLKGSRKLTKYTNEYYRKYRSLTQAEKLRDYLVQHSQQRQHNRHHYRSSGGHGYPNHHDLGHHRDTSHQHQYHHQCCCSSSKRPATNVIPPPCSSIPTAQHLQKCLQGDKSKHFVSDPVGSRTFKRHSTVCPTKSDPYPRTSKQNVSSQTSCGAMVCPLKYFSEPHLYSDSSDSYSSNILDTPLITTQPRRETRHVRFLNPLHTSAPDLGQSYKVNRVLPTAPDENLAFPSRSTSMLLKERLTVPQLAARTCNKRYCSKWLLSCTVVPATSHSVLFVEQMKAS